MTDVVTPDEEQLSQPPPVEPPRPHPVRIVDDDDLRRSRLPVLVRWLLAYPHFVWLGLYTVVAVLVPAVDWFIAIVLGRIPRGMEQLGLYCLRYQAQTHAYLLLVTDRYPSTAGN